MWSLKNIKIEKILTLRFWTSIKAKKEYHYAYNIVIYLLSIKYKKKYPVSTD
jgi:hypothetical protein